MLAASTANWTAKVTGHSSALVRPMQSAVLAAAVVAASGSHVQSAPVRSSQTGPLFGTEWSGTVASNMTQIGFDMGMVLVNFTGQCATPSTQRARTVYGDFYTLLLLCDQGIEYEIAPPSRGGGCKKRVVGKDLDPRVCQVCTCPFCIRDTNGSYPNTTWDGPVKHTEIGGVEVTVWSGHQSSGEHDSHRVSVAFTGNKITGSPEPFGTNISDELWVTSRAMILNYQPTAPISDLRVPAICKQLGTGPDEPGALPGAADHATLHNRWSQHAMWPRRPAVSAPAELAAVAQPAWREDPAERAALLELVRDLTTWTILRNMTLITAQCGATRSLSIKWA